MFRDVGPSAALQEDRAVIARVGLSTLLPYGFLVAATLATAIHLILSALHAPFRLLPMPEPGYLSQGAGPSVLMAVSVAGLLMTLAALGVAGWRSTRARLEQAGEVNSIPIATKPELVETLDAPISSGFLVLFQVTHFAFISSRYGSDAANAVTRLVVEELARTFRAPHQLTRTAPGEFLIMAASQSPHDCILLVEEVRRSVATRMIATGGLNLTVALAAGIADVSPNAPMVLALDAARRALDHARNTACERPVFAFDGHAKVLP